METIGVEMRGPVAWLWLDRPQWLNAMNEALLAELRQAFEELDRDEAVGAIVVAGRGRAFSAGFDVGWMAGQSVEAMAARLPDVEAVYDTVKACRRPVVAAVHGAALGGGLLLALVADLRLADETARFGAPEVKIGIFPNLALVPRLARIVGLGAAKWMVLTGEAVDAGEALRLGLVERVLPAGELQAEAQALAEHLAALPARALRSAKAAFAAARRPDYAAWEREQFADCWADPQREVAMRAFLQARSRPGPSR
ncbi:MAG: enoyl-CoA hydratase/isomerase family protein [Anaerolineae bacterium]|jgi:enoyl-CoA hydratase